MATQKDDARPKAPGLRWNGKRPLWRATKAALAAGYPVKHVYLTGTEDPRLLVARCQRLQAEMLEWLAGGTRREVTFDGTIKSVIDIYMSDKESPFHKLKPSTQHPYSIYARKLKATVGARQIAKVDGRDLRRWHRTWVGGEDGTRPTIAAAKMAMCVLQGALAYAKACRMRGAAELHSIISDITFPSPPPRQFAPSRELVGRACEEAHALGHHGAALAYAIQFECTVRQYDVIGEWIPLADKRPSAIISGKRKWIGPLWSQVSDDLVFVLTPSKTENTTGVSVTLDLRACPMVMQEISRLDPAHRTGALILAPAGEPYRQENYREVWAKVRKKCGLPAGIWNRDLRAGGVTEARRAGASRDDVAKVAGHSRQTSARVYDRDTLEAHRRIAEARRGLRSRNE